MRNAMLKAVVAALLPCAPVLAGQVELAAGLAQPGLNESEQPWAVGSVFRLGYVHSISSRWSFAAFGTYQNFLNDTTTVSTIKFNFSEQDADRRWRALSLDVGAQLALDRPGGLDPYARGTLGVSFWNVKYLNGDAVPAQTQAGQPTDFAAQEVVLRGGLGVTYHVSTELGLSLELEGAYLTGWGADFSEATAQQRSRGIATLLFKMSYEVGSGSGDVEIADAVNLRSPAPTAGAEAPTDSDLDGIPDLVDLCPGTPREAAGWVDVQGCPVDSDRDGIPEYRDRCPQSDARWPVDSTGCVEDADADGIADLADSCLATPAGVRVNQIGCPDYPALEDTLVLHFEYPPGGTELNARSQARLRELVPTILYHPSVPIEICAYTDSWGKAAQNLELSRERAQLVLEFLVSAGVPATLLTAVGRGAANFVASNDTPEGRALNRRIEISPRRK